MTHDYLLDASALLALIFAEPGGDIVEGLLDRAAIHAVNLAEAARKMVAMGMPADEVVAMLQQLQLHVIEELTVAEAMGIGRLGVAAKRLALSLGDCVCLSVAAARNLTAVTTERRWVEVVGNYKIHQIR